MSEYGCLYKKDEYIFVFHPAFVISLETIFQYCFRFVIQICLFILQKTSICEFIRGFKSYWRFSFHKFLMKSGDREKYKIVIIYAKVYCDFELLVITTRSSL